MRQNRSRYDLVMNCDMNQVNQLIQSYLSSTGFKFIQKSKESYYRGGDSIKGYWYFNYFINGNNLTIFAWLKGLFSEIKLDNGFYGAVTKMPYKNSLNVLFQELSRLNSQYGGNNNMNNNMNNNNNMYNQ